MKTAGAAGLRRLTRALGGRADPAAQRAPLAFERNAPYAPTPDNRPIPLDRGRLQLTRDPGWQMSFGERAAVEGILTQLRPELALEIGTAEGGCLERIAAHSDEVHSIDLTHEPVTRPLPAHVVLHTGSSRELLAPLLASFAQAGRGVDFALVDGDHSYDGVWSDLSALLDSPVAARSVLLVHDTMNVEIRAGIESLQLEEHAKVVYRELDFVPGYVYRDGVCHRAAWGGIGLLLTDTSRSPDCPLGSRQTRYYEPFAALQRFRAELAAEPPPPDGVRSVGRLLNRARKRRNRASWRRSRSASRRR